MQRAQKRDAVLNQRFFFRNHIQGQSNDDDSYSEMSIHDIMNGSATNNFPGLIPLVRQYIEETNPDLDAFDQLNAYLDELSQRASGEKKTNAKEIREIVMNHPDYKGDSIVPPSVNYDIVKWYTKG